MKKKRTRRPTIEIDEIESESERIERETACGIDPDRPGLPLFARFRPQQKIRLVMRRQEKKVSQGLVVKKATMKNIYYAHALCVYGTPCERKELKAIRTRFRKCKIVNPSRYSEHPEKLRDNVEFCLRLVAKCDIVVYSCLLGKITAGVGKQVNHALKLGKIVYEIQSAGLVQR